MESINSLQLKYASKNYSYRYKISHTSLKNIILDCGLLSMVIRACLVALDWNYGVNRKHKKGENGELLYREKVDIKLYLEFR